MNLQFLTRAINNVMAQFAAPQMLEQALPSKPKLNDGWNEFVMGAIGNEQRKNDAWSIDTEGHTFYALRLVEGIQAEMTSRVNASPSKDEIMMWEQTSAGHCDYASKLARRCYEFQMHHEFKETLQ